MSDRLLNEPFEISGQWHLPETPNQVISGILHYTPGHAELHLDNTFRPLRGTISAGDSIESYPLVYGVTKKGDAVTLVNAQRMGISLNFGSGGLRQPERLITTLLLIGAHTPRDFAFPKMSFRVPGLQIWQSRKNIDCNFEEKLPDNGWIFSYSVKRPPKESIRVPAINSDLDWHVGVNANADQFSTVEVTVSAWVTIRPDTPQQLTWYLEQLIKLTTMLALLAGVPMSPDCVSASVDGSNHEVYVMVALPDVSYCKHTNLHEFFLTRGAMGVEFGQVLAQWYEIYSRVHMPSRLAMSILASEKLWLHVEFLSLMQALEGFHRGLFEGTYVKEESEYEKVKEALERAIPGQLGADHKSALRARIKYGNEISLRKRLDMLAERVPEPLRDTIFGIARKVPQKWIDTRNYYTHWDEGLRANVLDGQDMYHANVRMRHFLRVVYIDLMGVPQEALIKTIGNASSISQHLIQINAIERRRVNPNDKTGVIMTVTDAKALDESVPGKAPSSGG